MGYYFDAIQRAAGVEPIKPEAPESVPLRAHTPAPPGVTASRQAAVVSRESSERLPQGRRKFSPQLANTEVIVTAKTTLETNDIIAVEHFRDIRARLAEIGRTRTLRTIVVTSANPGEGKTSISLNLAFASSHVMDKRTLLIDADMRRPCIAKILGMPNGPSITDYLAGRAAYDDLAWEVRPQLDVITASESMEASELLHGRSLVEFLKQSAERYDYVFIDTPPLASVADAHLLAANADGVLFVVRTGSSMAVVAKATERVKSKLLGIVLNFSASTNGVYQYGTYGNAKPNQGKRK